jgi:hypothetical protein
MGDRPDTDPAWPLVQAWSSEATNPHRFLLADDDTGTATLESLDGITERSVLGALARHCAALVIDDWLVVLGAGGNGFPGLREFNAPGPDAIDGALLVAVDVMGGGFAINGGGIAGAELGEVCYLAPDELEWMACDLGHAAFVQWALSGPLDQFYESLRWPEWRADAATLSPGQGISSYPPPWTREGRQPGVHRRPVPLIETWGVVLSAARQLGDAETASRGHE